jgi:hypothetical protein
MKLKMIWITTMALVLAAGVEWFEPHHLSAQTNAPPAGDKILYYTCPMHASVKSEWPGRCPECGMALVPVYSSDLPTNSAPSGTTNHPPADTNLPPKTVPKK